MIITTLDTDEGTQLDLSGRIDTVTSPELENAIKEVLGSAKKLILNFKDIDYISSAGLRVILWAYKQLEPKKLEIINTSDTVKEVFNMTGFSDILSVR